MLFEFDNAKNEANRLKHGVDFALAEAFEWEDALVLEDARMDYGEVRYKALGEIRGRLYVLIFTLRDDTCRIISLRKANARERRGYEQA